MAILLNLVKPRGHTFSANRAISCLISTSCVVWLLSTICRQMEYITVECGSSVIERRTRNQESPGSNHPCYRFEAWAFLFYPLTPQSTELYK